MVLSRSARPAGIVLAVSAAVFVALALGHATHPARNSLDHRLLGDVERLRAGWLNPVERAISVAGTGWVLYPLLVVAGVALWWRRREWLPGVLALGWLWLGQLVRVSINSGIARPRPPASLQLSHAMGYAFPSGHASTSTMGYALLALLAMRLAASGWWWALLVAPALVGLSRVYLGLHWPSDVVAGWAFGAAWVALGVLALKVPVRARTG